jgi:hypothetical protein
MDITFDDDGTVTILMKEYLKEAIAHSGMDASKVAPTPAKKDLFTADDGSEQLDKRQGEIFHSIVPKLLYVFKRARTDAQLAIAFLCTRVSCSMEQDWKKLIRLLQYFNGTLDMPLILGADSLAESKSWVDAAYAVHNEMKSHTGGATSLGRGAIMCKSTKQKLHTKSSTEAKVVGSSDYLPNTIWARMFLAEQGYELTENIFSRITRALSDLRRMVEHPAGRSPGTLTFVTSLCRTVSSPRVFLSSTVPRTRCLPISLQSLFKAVCFGNPGRSSRSLSCEYALKISATSIRGAC